MELKSKILHLSDEFKNASQNLEYWRKMSEDTKNKLDNFIVKNVRDAILKSTHYRWEQIISSKRPDSLRHLRVIFGYHCDKLGVDNARICIELNKNRATTMYYPYDYKNCKNPDFLRVAKKVEENLEL